jgi:hypothetical protein
MITWPGLVTGLGNIIVVHTPAVCMRRYIRTWIMLIILRAPLSHTLSWTDAQSSTELFISLLVLTVTQCELLMNE